MIAMTVGLLAGGIAPVSAGERRAEPPTGMVQTALAQTIHTVPSARGKRIVAPEQIQAAIHRHVMRELAGRVVDCQVTLGEPQQPVVLPPGMVEVKVGAGRSEEPLGRRLFQIQLLVNGRLAKTVEATADIAAVVEVVVTNRLIKTDEVIEAEDVGTDQMVLFDLKQTFVTNPTDVIGKAAARPLSPQSPIRITAVRRPFVVRKGDRVTIEARQGGLSIQTVGVTKSHGEVGQTITVSNVDSGKDLQAIVVGAGVVRVNF